MPVYHSSVKALSKCTQYQHYKPVSALCAKRRFAHNSKRIQYEIRAFVLFPDTNAVLSAVFRSSFDLNAFILKGKPLCTKQSGARL
jgi:hypothetical protein